jgi:galactokinase
MTGDGFGGLTIWLVERDKAQEIVSGVSEAYGKRLEQPVQRSLQKASQGARLVEENRSNVS